MSRTELVLLRHGESLWNAEDRYQGQMGTGLSAFGQQQAKEAAEYLRAADFDQIVASDLQRVTETLQPYLDSGDLPAVRVDRRWREIDVGSWGGRTFADVYAAEPGVVEAFGRGEDVARGGGETFAQLRERVWDAIREIAGSGAGRVLVVTHGGPIRVATASTLRLPPGGEVLLDPPVNCSLTTIQVDDLLAVTTLTAYNVPTSGTASTEEQPA
ncbi:histidine phosphatase family protein [Kribbella capetownensis]|uniref:Histidine phosphatase family protein n=1 Tax=Kribbella capetownensis TaxID=1572659 RepID=A0A4R0JKG9_9ACTN|nr:histidine phosphatase family protein [Kribbella capetownensis]TCC45248.1 histidine phosphatase family protein [Kribbella capetownensis]